MKYSLPVVAWLCLLPLALDGAKLAGHHSVGHIATSFASRENVAKSQVHPTDVGNHSTAHERIILPAQCSFSADDAVILTAPIPPGACPAECPFSQTLVGDRCAAVCVAAGACTAFHPSRGYADEQSMSCLPTCGDAAEERVAGCEVCAGRGKCAKCSRSWFVELQLSSDGSQCTSPFRWCFMLVYFLLGCSVVGVLYYLIVLAYFRKPHAAGEEILTAALKHRHRCRPLEMRPVDTGYQWAPYTWFGLNPHKASVSGIGMKLYFNLLLFLGFVALVLWIGCQLALFFSNPEIERAERFEDSGCGGEVQLKPHALVEDERPFQKRMFYALVATYCVILLSSWAFFYAQLCVYSNRKRGHSLSNFVMLVSGLPADAIEERPLMQEFQAKIGDSTEEMVVGVSICYALASHSDELKEGLDAWTVEKEGTREARREDVVQDGTASVISRFSALRPIDDILVGDRPERQEAKKRMQDVMQKVECSGDAFVILSNEAAVCRLDEGLRSQPKVMGSKIQWCRPLSEPLSIMWENFERPEKRHFARKIAASVTLIAATICVWALFYMPYAVGFSVSAQVPGRKPSELLGFFLGALIGLGNVIVSNVIEKAMEWIGFRFKDVRDLWVMGLAFLFCLLNVVADIWMTIKIAKGTHLDEAFEGDEVGYDKVVVRELFALIVPGYLFVPYLLEPFVEYVLPYWVYRWLVRSDARFSPREAEKALEPPEMDIVWRYADSLNNFAICMILLLFVTPGSSSIMLWLFAFIIYIYCLDKLRICHYAQTFYTTHCLSCAFACWWAIPTGVLAGVVAWWGVKAGILTKYSPLLTVCIASVVHVIAYLIIVALLYAMQPPTKHAEGEYLEATEYRHHHGKAWDYFTANPGHCLRTWGSKNESFPVVRGKLHLLPWRDWECGGGSSNFASDVDQSGILSRAPWKHFSTSNVGSDRSPGSDV